MRNEIDLIVKALNSGEKDAIETLLLELRPKVHERGRVYTTSLSLYTVLEEQVKSCSINDVLHINKKLNDSVWKRNITLLAISKFLNLGDLQKSEELIQILNKEYQYQGYRLLLNYYSEKGDLKGYNRVLRKSDKRKNKSELISIERKFISSFSKKNDINRTIEQIDGTKTYLFKDAIIAKIDTITSDEILELMRRYLSNCPLMFVEVYIELLSFEVNNERSITSLVNPLVDFIKTIDPKSRVSGTSFTEKSLSLWKLGSYFIDSGFLGDSKEIIKLMNNGSSKKNLIERINSSNDVKA